MRQGKLSELIHNSAGSEDLDSCSVEVWFEEIIDKVDSRFVSACHSDTDVFDSL
jgi:chromosome segregation ATPase